MNARASPPPAVWYIYYSLIQIKSRRHPHLDPHTTILLYHSIWWWYDNDRANWIERPPPSTTPALELSAFFPYEPVRAFRFLWYDIWYPPFWGDALSSHFLEDQEGREERGMKCENVLRRAEGSSHWGRKARKSVCRGFIKFSGESLDEFARDPLPL